MLVSLLSLNAEPPISLTPYGMVTLVMSAFLNASLPMAVIFLPPMTAGITTSASKPMYENYAVELDYSPTHSPTSNSIINSANLSTSPSIVPPI